MAERAGRPFEYRRAYFEAFDEARRRMCAAGVIASQGQLALTTAAAAALQTSPWKTDVPEEAAFAFNDAAAWPMQVRTMTLAI